jgi:hypothetical protein
MLLLIHSIRQPHDDVQRKHASFFLFSSVMTPHSFICLCDVSQYAFEPRGDMRIGGAYTYVIGHDICGVDADRGTFLLVSLLMSDNKRCHGYINWHHGFIATALPQQHHHHQSPIPTASSNTHHDDHRITIHHPSRSYLYPRTFGDGVLALHALSSSL